MAAASLDDFEILAPAGRGAFSVVYRARERRSGTLLALKVLTAAAGSDAGQPDEVLAAASLQHPNIVRTLASGVDGGRRWIALEWVPGHDLGRYVGPRLQLPEPMAVEIAAALADALGHAHRQGIVHRDLKPANVRVHLPQRLVKLGDFGIASLHEGTATATGMLRGTPAYMAPDVLQGARATAASDLYALGVVLFELLAARRPHRADSLGQLLASVARAPPVLLSELRPDLPPALLDLVASLLQPDPAERARHTAHLAERLHEIAAHWPRC